MRRSALLAVSLVVALASSGGYADVYRWVDARGGVHYSDVPIEGAVRIKATLPRAAVPAPAAPATTAAAAAAGSAPVAPGAQADAARAVQQDLAKKRSEQCKVATERYENAINSRRLYRQGKNGEREYLSDAELTQARIQAKLDRDQACAANR
jgi:hypothetical protein